MSDEVVIRFSTDVSELQRGLQQAASTMDATVGALRSGAAELEGSFGSLTKAYASSAAQRASAARQSGASELAIARQVETVRRNIAIDGVREEAAVIRQQAQSARISRQDELASLIALNVRREAIERNHLQFLAGTYRQGTAAYAAVQARMTEVASESAARRREIERNVSSQIEHDYRRSFEQVGSSISRSVGGLVQGTMTLRDAARNILLQIIQQFVQARVRMVADWLAGVAAQTAATTAGETAKTAAVAAGTAARTGLETTAAATSGLSVIGGILKAIFASAAQTFAGIFGFLSPVMGPAAMGPALAGQATVMGAAAGIASFDVGSWELPSDMIAKVHKGEMIIPAGPASAWRRALSDGPIGADSRRVTVNHATNINISALDAQSVKRFLKNNDRALVRAINEGVRTGANLGLSKIGE